MLLVASGCRKNELTLSGTLSDGNGQTLRIIYRAADKEKSFLVDNPIPLEGSGSFSLKVATRYPTVLWVYSMRDGDLLMAIYAERGDELSLSGKYTEPWAWEVKGNKVMEQYGEWARANAKALKSGDAGQINAAVAAYVKEEPDSRTAAFLLFTRFTVAGHEAEYKSLVSKLDLDEDDLKEMREACLAPEQINVPAAGEFGKLRLPDTADSLISVSPAGSKATLLYFWRETPTAEIRSLIEDVNADTLRRAVSVYLDTDTVRWHQLLRTDTVLGETTALWALGGEINQAVKPLGVTGTPTLMVVDGRGKVLYRGAEADKARASVYPK